MIIFKTVIKKLIPVFEIAFALAFGGSWLLAIFGFGGFYEFFLVPFGGAEGTMRTVGYIAVGITGLAAVIFIFKFIGGLLSRRRIYLGAVSYIVLAVYVLFIGAWVINWGLSIGGVTSKHYDILNRCIIELEKGDDGTYSVTGYTGTGTALVIPDSHGKGDVVSVSGEAFKDCTALTSVNTGNGVTTIGADAFAGCTSLISVTIGSEVNTIRDGAFSDCYKLAEVYNLSSLTIKKGSEGYGYAGYYALDVYTSPDTESKITEKNKYIFYEDVDSVYLMGYKGNAANLTLPEKFNDKDYAVYQYAFYKNENLTEVGLPETVTSIGKYAFYNCSALTAVTIPENTEYIGNYAFYNCSSLTRIAFNATECEDFTKNNNVFNCGENGSDGVKVTVGEKVTKIPAYLFYPDTDKNYPPKIVNLEFAEGSACQSIGAYAFRYCSSLKILTIGENVTSIGDSAFYNCTNLTEIYFNAIECEDLTSSNYVFENAGKNGQGITVTIGEKVTRIPAFLFASYSASANIVNVEFTKGGVCESIGRMAFAFGSIKRLTIPDSVKIIESYAFYNCNALASVTFETTEGWNRYLDETVGEPIAEEDLSSPETAAKLIKSYYAQTWKRG